MEDTCVTKEVLGVARMAVIEGINEGRPAHGFFIIVGNAIEILADERRDPHIRDIKLTRYGDFKTYLDRRRENLKISDCLGDGKRSFLNLLNEDGAIVVDGRTGQVCCGGFFVNNSTSGIGSGGARTRAASAMATQAGGCYVVLASEDICGSTQAPAPASATLKVFNTTTEPDEVPVRVLDTVREQSLPQLKHWLQPLEIGADLRRHNEDFVEDTRQWIFDEIDEWRRDPDGLRCKVLLAGPGFGKTTIAARLSKLTTKVLGIHLFRYKESSNSDPRRMIASLAFQIAEKLPKFKDALHKVHEAEVHKVREAEVGATDAYLLRPSARELAYCLLLEPLSDIEPPEPVTRNGRYVIIIDALDEVEHDAKNELLELIASDFYKFPAWIAVLVTARPESNIRKALEICTLLDEDEKHTENCKLDVRVYLRKILEPKIEDERRLNNAIERISIKSEGLFLYLHYIRDNLKNGDDIVALQDALPNGLAGVYQKELASVLGPDGLGGENSDTRRVVEAIVAAQVPAVAVAHELPGLCGIGSEKAVEIVEKLSRLFPVRNGRVYMFHKSFVAWLTGKDGFDRRLDQPKFFVDLRAAHAGLASACSVQLLGLLEEGLGEEKRCCFESDKKAAEALKRFLEARRRRVDDSCLSSAPEDYALRWSVKHLVEAKQLSVGLALLCSLRFLMRRAPQIDTLIADALLLPQASLLHRALLLAQNHLQPVYTHWLAEELWQRLLRPAETDRLVDLSRLAEDARKMARAELKFSARRAYLTPADSCLRCVLEGHKFPVSAVTTFDANGYTWVASCSYDKTVRIWNPMTGGSAIHLLEGHSLKVKGVTAFDADGRTWVASFSDDKTVRTWDPIKGGKAVHVFEGHDGPVNGVTACVDDRRTWLASCSNDRSVRIWNAKEGGAVRVLIGHTNVVSGVAFVNVNCQTAVASCSFDKTVRVWAMNPDEPDDSKHSILKGHSAFVTGLSAFVCAKGNTRLASCSDDRTVRIWDPELCQAIRVLKSPSGCVKGVAAIVYLNNAWVVASCGKRSETVCIWDATSCGKGCRELNGHAKSVTGLTLFVADKCLSLASCSEDNTVRTWKVTNHSKEANHVLEGHFGEVKGLTAFKDNNNHAWVASCSSDMTVRIWDSMKGSREAGVLVRHSGKVNGLTAFADAKGHSWVASCSDDKTVRIWEAMKDGESKCQLKDHSHYVRGITSFNADGRTWLASCSERIILIWDANKFDKPVRTLEGHRAYVCGVTAFVDAKGNTWLASCSMDMRVHIWNGIKGDQPVYVLKGHEKCINGVTAILGSDKRTRVASCSKDKTVRIWDAFNGGKAEHVLEGHEDEVTDVKAFVGATGTWVASCSFDKTVRIWDAKNGGDAKQVLTGHSAPINGITCVDAQGSNTWVASCSNDGTVRIWDATDGKAVFVIPLDNPPTAILAISTMPACARNVRVATSFLAIGHRNGKLTLWDYMQGRSEQRTCCFL